MKSPQAISRYLDQGYVLVNQPPEGCYLSDGNGNYQLVTEGAAEEALTMDDDEVDEDDIMFFTRCECCVECGLCVEVLNED